MLSCSLEPNKLTLTQEAVDALGLTPRVSRLSVGYRNGKPFLVIDNEAGNLLTKGGSVSFRGSQNTYLKTYGDSFEINVINNTMFELSPITH